MIKSMEHLAEQHTYMKVYYENLWVVLKQNEKRFGRLEIKCTRNKADTSESQAPQTNDHGMGELKPNCSMLIVRKEEKVAPLAPNRSNRTPRLIEKRPRMDHK